MDEISSEKKKTGQIRSLILGLLPLIAKKSSVLVCHQHDSFSLDWIFPKLADEQGMDEISYKFETGPDQIINFRVVSTDCWKKPVWLLSA